MMTRMELKERFRSERGDSELISALVLMPIILWLIFSLIDISLYMQARMEVQNTARDGARLAATYGGNKSQLNPTSDSVETILMDRLWEDGKCTPSLCESPPIIDCTPDIATATSQAVSCSITYRYNPIYDNNVIGGFSAFLGHSFTLKETAYSETGF